MLLEAPEQTRSSRALSSSNTSGSARPNAPAALPRAARPVGEGLKAAFKMAPPEAKDKTEEEILERIAVNEGGALILWVRLKDLDSENLSRSREYLANPEGLIRSALEDLVPQGVYDPLGTSGAVPEGIHVGNIARSRSIS